MQHQPESALLEDRPDTAAREVEARHDAAQERKEGDPDERRTGLLLDHHAREPADLGPADLVTARALRRRCSAGRQFEGKQHVGLGLVGFRLEADERETVSSVLLAIETDEKG